MITNTLELNGQNRIDTGEGKAMTKAEEDRELGAAMRERLDTKNAIACLDNKRSRMSKSLKRVAEILDEVHKIDWNRDPHAGKVHFQIQGNKLQSDGPQGMRSIELPTEEQVVEVITAYKQGDGELERLNRTLKAYE